MLILDVITPQSPDILKLEWSAMPTFLLELFFEMLILDVITPQSQDILKLEWSATPTFLLELFFFKSKICLMINDIT